MALKDWERSLIDRQRVARLATVDETGQPHVVPIVYAFDGQRLFTPVDAKPKRVGPHQLRRVRDLQASPRVAVIVDEYSDDWRDLAWVQIRGRATLVESGPEYDAGLALLEARYPQYTAMPLAGRPLIIIRVQHITGWRARPNRVGGGG
jgi:PPOX class probable F420-dependent enzyme